MRGENNHGGHKNRQRTARQRQVPAGRASPAHTTALRPRREGLIAAAIVLLAGALSLWRVSGRTLYWDDFLIPAIYGDPETRSVTSLFALHDGHLMPGAIAIQLLVDRFAPLSWWLPAGLIVAGTLLAGAAWTASGVARRRPLVLVLLCFSPFLGVALGWWSAALNALGWQIACALAIWALRRCTPGSPHRQLLPGLAAALAVLAGLLFSEKALSIVPLLTAVAIFFPSSLFPRCQDATPPTFRALALLPGWVVTVGWAGLYVALNRAEAGPEGAPGSVVWDSLPRALSNAIAPGLLGGPWHFERWSPGASFASPATVASVLAIIAVVVALAAWLWQARTQPRGVRLRVLALVLSAGYLLVVFASLALARSGVGTADVMTSSLHYYADWFAATVVLCTAATVESEQQPVRRSASSRVVTTTAKTPRTAASRATGTAAGRQRLRAGQPIVALAFIASAVVTTAGYLDSWRDDHTAQWLHNVKSSLRASTAPLLPQPVPATIANRFGPQRVDIGEVARSLPDWPGVSAGTPTPQFLLDDGRLVAGDVLTLGANTTADGERGGGRCGQRIPLNKPTLVRLDKPLKFGEWTWVFNTSASTPVNVRIHTPNGLESYEDSLERAHRVAVPAELNQQYVRVSGGGDTIEVLASPARRSTPAAGNYLCLGTGEIGPLLPAGGKTH